MHKFTFKTGVFLSLCILFYFAASANAESKKEGNKNTIAATVNGVEISRADYVNTLDLAKQQFAGIGAKESAASGKVNIEEEVLERLIGIELMLQDAKKRGLVADAVAIDIQVAGFRDSFKTEEEFNSYLKKNNISVDAVKDQIAKQLTLQQLQSTLRKELIENNIASEKDTKVFYDSNLEKFRHPEQIKASHILIKVEKDAEETVVKEALTKIEGIRKKAIASEDFAELAQKNSQGPTNVKGGDLGFFSKGQMVQPFDTAAFALQPDEISEVVKTQFGYHIIKLKEKRPAGVTPFAEVKDKINQYLSQVLLDQAQKQYTTNLRDKAKVEVNI